MRLLIADDEAYAREGLLDAIDAVSLWDLSMQFDL